MVNTINLTHTQLVDFERKLRRNRIRNYVFYITADEEGGYIPVLYQSYEHGSVGSKAVDLWEELTTGIDKKQNVVVSLVSNTGGLWCIVIPTARSYELTKAIRNNYK